MGARNCTCTNLLVARLMHTRLLNCASKLAQHTKRKRKSKIKISVSIYMHKRLVKVERSCDNYDRWHERATASRTISAVVPFADRKLAAVTLSECAVLRCIFGSGARRRRRRRAVGEKRIERSRAQSIPKHTRAQNEWIALELMCVSVCVFGFCLKWILNGMLFVSKAQRANGC